MTSRSKIGIVKPKLYAFKIQGISILLETRSFKKALKVIEQCKTIQVEMDALLSNGTWELVELPCGKKLQAINGCLR